MYNHDKNAFTVRLPCLLHIQARQIAQQKGLSLQQLLEPILVSEIERLYIEWQSKNANLQQTKRNKPNDYNNNADD